MKEQYAVDKKELEGIIGEFMNITDISTCITDFKSGEVIFFNESFVKDVKCFEDIENPQELSKATFAAQLLPKEMKQRLLEAKNKHACKWETYIDGHSRWFAVTGKVMDGIGGRLWTFLSMEDITERKKEEERIHYTAYNDKKLGIPNGRQLFEDLCLLEEEQSLYMISFNVQGLRNVNNLYGREAGDMLLKAITQWILIGFNEQFQIYRIENDDFVILIHESDELKVMNIARFLYNRFEKPWIVELKNHVEQEIYVGAYMGVIKIDEAPTSYEAMQSIDEKVMTYARKENRLILFDVRMDEELNQQLLFEENLKSCVLNNMQGFSLHYQPIVETNSRSWVGVEALCRWNRPGVGPVRPDIFIREAERQGLINILTRWVLDEAISQTKKWRLDEEEFMLDVNLSPVQLKDRELLGHIKEVLRRYNYPAGKLSLEITESAEVQFDEATLHQLDAIKKTGVYLSLDDFGTGYASFANLHALPVDVLKTDRFFMNGIEENEYLQQTIKVMVDFAAAAQIKVVAEGVETEKQCDILKERGVNMIQGYYFSKPLAREQMEANLERFQTK